MVWSLVVDVVCVYQHHQGPPPPPQRVDWWLVHCCPHDDGVEIRYAKALSLFSLWQPTNINKEEEEEEEEEETKFERKYQRGALCCCCCCCHVHHNRRVSRSLARQTIFLFFYFVLSLLPLLLLLLPQSVYICFSRPTKGTPKGRENGWLGSDSSFLSINLLLLLLHSSFQWGVKNNSKAAGEGGEGGEEEECGWPSIAWSNKTNDCIILLLLRLR